jgi:hypothetical protein
MSRLVALLVLLALLLVAVPALAGDEAFLGVWEGEWTSPRYHGRLVLTVTSVEAGRCIGTMNIGRPDPGIPQPYHEQDLPLTGTIAGGVLVGETFARPGSPRIQWQFTLDPTGTRLTGDGRGAVYATAQLVKKTP